MEDLKREVEELQEKVKKLEKKEKQRSTKETIKSVVKIVIILGIVFGIYRAYIYIDTTFIKPAQEAIEKVEGITNNITDNDLYNKLFGKKGN